MACPQSAAHGDEALLLNKKTSFCVDTEHLVADEEEYRRCYSIAKASRDQSVSGPGGARALEGGEPAGVSAASSSESASGSGPSSSSS